MLKKIASSHDYNYASEYDNTITNQLHLQAFRVILNRTSARRRPRSIAPLEISQRFHNRIGWKLISEII